MIALQANCGSSLQSSPCIMSKRDEQLSNTFEMLVSRLGVMEDMLSSLTKMQRLTVGQVASGSTIPGGVLGVPFDVVKMFDDQTCERVIVTLSFKNRVDIRQQPIPMDDLRLCAYTGSIIYAPNITRRLEEVCSDVRLVLEMLKVPLHDVSYITVSHVSNPCIHELLYEANAADNKEAKIQKFVSELCTSDTQDAELVRRRWLTSYGNLHMDEQTFQYVMHKFEEFLGAY